EKTAQSVHGFQAPTHPTRNPGLSALPDYRLVFAFDAPPGLTGKALCAGKTGRAPISGRQEVQAAYCLKDMVLTEVRGSSGRTEADLRHLTEQSMLVLFQQDPASHTDTEAWP
ncbi:MAG: hypothetical protein K2Q10_09755, partial [Rhodospirillales bacterium]|nr:hypothetical protein [Rhodospirillales bacterium]